MDGPGNMPPWCAERTRCYGLVLPCPMGTAGLLVALTQQLGPPGGLNTEPDTQQSQKAGIVIHTDESREANCIMPFIVINGDCG